MPVQACDLDDLVIATSLLIEASLYAECDNQKIDDACRHVHTMETRDHEEARAELRGAHGVVPRSYAFLD